MTGRATQLTLVAVMAVAGVGFLVGINDGVPRPESDSPVPAARESREPATENVVPSSGYRDLRRVRIGENAGLELRTADLAYVPEAPTEKASEAEKLRALEDRAERRAYNGAPPVIPHDVDEISSEACLECHLGAVRLANETADRVPHPYYTQCQQCHVAESPLEEPRVLSASAFRGLPAPTEGERAWEGAPPTIPHSTWMRNDCLSCHGPGGKVGLRTSHAERTNCLQCHGISAELDQVPVGPARFLAQLSGK